MTDPRFQLFAALDAATEAALRASIERFGVLVPVAKDQHGRVLDGHQRSRIADELGVPYRVDVISVSGEDEAREIAHTLNADRRQLSVEQRREVVADLRAKGHSLRAIGGALGVTKSQIERDLATVPQGTVPERVTGLDGKSRPSRRPTVVAAKNEREAERAQVALTTVTLPSVPVIDVKRAERLAREQLAEQRRAEDIVGATEQDNIVVVHGDYRDVLSRYDVTNGIVITDPPYPREFLNEWGEMAQAALEAGCDAIVAMCGQAILPDAIAEILRVEYQPTAENVWRWQYRWCGAYLTKGAAARVWSGNVGTNWKPILIFDQDDERDFLAGDVFESTGDDKHHHHWGQNEHGIAQLVQAFTQPGDLVVDPFLGGGTTAVVCRDLGRQFVGCDIDSNAVSSTRQRLAA